jgi:hypothetical protein
MCNYRAERPRHLTFILLLYELLTLRIDVYVTVTVNGTSDGMWEWPYTQHS